MLCLKFILFTYLWSNNRKSTSSTITNIKLKTVLGKITRKCKELRPLITLHCSKQDNLAKFVFRTKKKRYTWQSFYKLPNGLRLIQGQKLQFLRFFEVLLLETPIRPSIVQVSSLNCLSDEPSRKLFVDP